MGFWGSLWCRNVLNIPGPQSFAEESKGLGNWNHLKRSKHSVLQSFGGTPPEVARWGERQNPWEGTTKTLPKKKKSAKVASPIQSPIRSYVQQFTMVLRSRGRQPFASVRQKPWHPLLHLPTEVSASVFWSSEFRSAVILLYKLRKRLKSRSHYVAPAQSGTSCVDQADLNLTEICLASSSGCWD